MGLQVLRLQKDLVQITGNRNTLPCICMHPTRDGQTNPIDNGQWHPIVHYVSFSRLSFKVHATLVSMEMSM